jgi:hypothetical protein
MIWKEIKMHYVMQDRTFVGLPNEIKLFRNIQLLNYNNKFGIERKNWVLLIKLFFMYI